MSELRTVGYEPARRSEILALMREVWGSTPLERELEWWFEQNPAGGPIITLAEEDGRVVGVACMSPYRVLVGGEKRLVAVPLHVATHPAYRGRGIFTALEAENERRAAEGSSVAITFPNEASRRVFAGRLGWRELPAPRIWARPLPFGRRPRGVEQLGSFGAEADALWQEASADTAAGLVRDAAYLGWRFARSPRPYRCLGVVRKGVLRGIAVVGRRRWRGVECAFLADLVAPRRDRRALRALLQASLAEARGARLFLALPPHGRAGSLARLGFAPTHKRVLFMGKELRPGGGLPERWTLSLGDGDSF